MLYATNRRPALAEEKKHRFYSDTTQNVLRVGSADVEIVVDPETPWVEARQQSITASRKESYPLVVQSIDEFGVLGATVDSLNFDVNPDPAVGERFVRAVDQQLQDGPGKDLYIYVHGYKVVYEEPLLVSSELWHFMGYRGAFVAFSWPSTRKTVAYAADAEDAAQSARYLRKLIVYLADNTEAERIHVIGFSAGTRVVARMVADFALLGYFLEAQDIGERLRLGNIFLFGADVQRELFAGYLADGALRVAENLYVYQSTKDTALGVSRRVLDGGRRVGEFLQDDSAERTARFLADNSNLRIINVTDAEQFDAGHGHAYFKDSPWVSSDLLLTLMLELEPAERGLVLNESTGIWEFPVDYPDQLRRIVAKAGLLTRLPYEGPDGWEPSAVSSAGH